MQHSGIGRIGANLKPVDWSAVTPADTPFGTPANFPPEQVRARIERSRLRWDMEHGVWSRLLNSNEPEFTVQANLFRTISDRLAQLLTSSPLLTGDESMDYDFYLLITDAATAILRDNTPIFWTSPFSDIPMLLDPRFFWETTEGWVYAVPTTVFTGNEALLDYTIQRGDTLTNGEAYFSGSQIGYSLGANPGDGSIGQVIDERVIEWPDTLSVPGRFGQSRFDVLASLVIEISRRHSFNSFALNKLANPVQALLAHKEDMASIEPDTGTNEEITDDFDDLGSSNAITRSNAADSYMEATIGNNTYVSFDKAIQGIQPVEYNGRIELSGDRINDIRKEIEAAVHMPDLFNGFAQLGSAPSGVALRRLNIPLHGTVSSAQAMIRRGINESLSQAGIEMSYEWPDVFEVLEGNFTESEGSGDEQFDS